LQTGDRSETHVAIASGISAYLAAMAALSFVSMYVLMYAMADPIKNVIPNWNQAYMAAS
jgi:hypothetical protein